MLSSAVLNSTSDSDNSGTKTKRYGVAATKESIPLELTSLVAAVLGTGPMHGIRWIGSVPRSRVRCFENVAGLVHGG